MFVLCRLTKKCVAPVQHRSLSGADAVNALRPFYFAVHPDFFAQYPKERVRRRGIRRASFGSDQVRETLLPHQVTLSPALQEVNENSLKRLNGYLENLQRPGPHSAPPVNLTFYVRETKDMAPAAPGVLGSGGASAATRSSGPHPRPSQSPSCSSGFRTVSFTLQTRDVFSAVTSILKSCSLPVEHMSGLKSRVEDPQGSHQAAAAFYRPIKWDKSYYSFTGFRDPEEDLQQARRMEPTLR